MAHRDRLGDRDDRTERARAPLRIAALCVLCTVALGAAPPAFPAPVPEAGLREVRPMRSPPLAMDAVLRRIAFGSCQTARSSLRILDTVAATEPDVFLLLGDNVYPEDESDRPGLPALREAYGALARDPHFSALRAQVPLLAVWDDHDYGRNDAGGAWARKGDAEALFLDAWAVPANDPRRARQGVYFARTYGPPGRRVQLIFLDTRYFRSPLRPSEAPGEARRERYEPSRDPDADMLGEAQWAWLRARLREPADLRVLVSSVQVVADGHGWEAWRTLPAARERLYALLRASGVRDLVILSGDRHLGALYRRDGVLPGPLLEATSSSLNRPLEALVAGDLRVEPGPHRLGWPVHEANFGTLELDWEARRLALRIHGADGQVLLETRRAFGTER